MKFDIQEYLENLYICLNSRVDDTSRRLSRILPIIDRAKTQNVIVDGRLLSGKMVTIAVDSEDETKIREENSVVYACHEEGYLAVLIGDNDIKTICYHSEVWRSLIPEVDIVIKKNVSSYTVEPSEDIFYEGNWYVLY